jgi:WD40 repeat protein
LAVVRDASLDLYDAGNGSRLWTRPDVRLGVPPIWSADGKMLLTGNRNRHNITVRESGTGALTAFLAGHNAFPVGARFLPDGKRVATLAFDGTLSVWDLPTTRELLQAPVAHRGFALSRDGKRLGAVSKSDKPALFELADEAVFHEFQGSFRVGLLPTGFAMSTDGEWLATLGIDTLRREARAQSIMVTSIWDTRWEHEAATFSFRSRRDDRVAMTFDSNTPAIVYSFSSGGIWRRDLHVDAERKLRVSAETRIASPGTHALVQIEPDGDWIVQRLPARSLARWPMGDASREAELALPIDSSEFRIQIDRHYLIGCDPTEASVRLWSRQTGAAIGKLAVPWPVWVAFSPLSDRMVVGASESYQTWMLPALEVGPEWRTRPEISSWKRFSFSASGRWFACGVGGGSVELRDGRTFALLTQLQPPLDLELTGLLWSPDETRIYLMFRGPRIFVWELPALRRELAARGLDW